MQLTPVNSLDSKASIDTPAAIEMKHFDLSCSGEKKVLISSRTMLTIAGLTAMIMISDCKTTSVLIFVSRHNPSEDPCTFDAITLSALTREDLIIPDQRPYQRKIL